MILSLLRLFDLGFEGQIIVEQCFMGTMFHGLDSKGDGFSFHSERIVASALFNVKTLFYLFDNTIPCAIRLTEKFNT